MELPNNRVGRIISIPTRIYGKFAELSIRNETSVGEEITQAIKLYFRIQGLPKDEIKAYRAEEILDLLKDENNNRNYPKKIIVERGNGKIEEIALD